MWDPAQLELPPVTLFGAIASVLLPIGLMAVGLLCVRFIGLRDPIGSQLGLHFPLGAGAVTYAAFLLSWLGIRLTAATLVLLLVFLIAALAGALRWRQPTLSATAPDQSRDNTTSRWAVLLFLGLLIAAGVLSVGRSYSTWDAMASYSVKGYAIAHSGSIHTVNAWGSGSGYPLGIPLLISFFDVFQGDHLPLSKLTFTLFYASLAVGMFQFLARAGVQRTYALAGVLLFATLPVVYEHGTIGYVNLPLACFMTLGVFKTIEGLITSSRGQLIVGGMLLGFSTWVRPDGLPIAMAAIVGLVLAARITRLGRPSLLALLIPIGVVSGLWQIYSWLWSPGGAQGSMLQALAAFFRGVGEGELHLDAFYWIARFAAGQLKEPSLWGLALPLAVAVIIVKRKSLVSPNLPLSFVLLAVTLSVGAALVFFYYLIAFFGDLLYWLGTDINRMLLPVVSMGWAWIISLWGEASDRHAIQTDPP